MSLNNIHIENSNVNEKYSLIQIYILFQENIATLLPMFATLTKSGHPAQPMLPSC